MTPILTIIAKIKPGLRPIGVDNIFIRVTGRSCMSTVGPEVAEYLKPLQFGVGVPGGAEIVAHIVSLGVEDIKSQIPSGIAIAH